MSSKTITVVIADDHSIFRAAVDTMISIEPDLRVIGEAGDGSEAVKVVLELQPDILLLDLSMPRGSGLEVLRQLREKDSSTRAIVLTGGDVHKHQMLEILRIGGCGVMSKGVPSTQMVKAIRTVAAGEMWLGRRETADVLEAVRGGAFNRNPGEQFGLTAREVDITVLLAKGRANKEVAQGLGISEDTVKQHLRSIFLKTGVQDRLELALFAIHNGLTRG
jgi:DNA-binding NarL/FixJ family response regulator